MLIKDTMRLWWELNWIKLLILTFKNLKRRSGNLHTPFGIWMCTCTCTNLDDYKWLGKSYKFNHILSGRPSPASPAWNESFANGIQFLKHSFLSFFKNWKFTVMPRTIYDYHLLKPFRALRVSMNLNRIFPVERYRQ